MDIVTYALCKNSSPSEDGKVFNIKGEVPSKDDLPTSGNTNGDVYLVGPQKDGSYDEYFWIDKDNKWEFMGSATGDLANYLKKDEAAQEYSTKAEVEQIQEDNQLVYIFDE